MKDTRNFAYAGTSAGSTAVGLWQTSASKTCAALMTKRTAGCQQAKSDMSSGLKTSHMWWNPGTATTSAGLAICIPCSYSWGGP